MASLRCNGKAPSVKSGRHERLFRISDRPAMPDWLDPVDARVGRAEPRNTRCATEENTICFRCVALGGRNLNTPFSTWA
jgi:hypothetical protein